MTQKSKKIVFTQNILNKLSFRVNLDSENKNLSCFILFKDIKF